MGLENLPPRIPPAPGICGFTFGIVLQETLMLRNTFVATVFAICAALALVIVMAPRSSAQTATVLYTFTGGTDGGGDQGALVFDIAGNLYGTTSSGGKRAGIVFQFSPRASGRAE